MFFESAQTINAEESYDYYYTAIRDMGDNDWVKHGEFNVPADASVYTVPIPSGPSFYVAFFIWNNDNESCHVPYDGIEWQHSGDPSSKNYTNSFDIYVYNRQDFINTLNSNTSWLPNGLSGYADPISNYETNIPTFSSMESFKQYLVDGNEDGWLNKPDIDYGIEHDFASDNYRTDIPIPEVSNMDFNSFKLTNWEEQYFVDIIIENRFLEVAIMNNTGNGWKKIFKPTGAKTYNWHYWNLMCHDVAYNQADIDIPTLFGFDPQAYLIEDFKTWSEQYPDLSNIDGYDFTMIAQKNDYKKRHVYDPESALTDEEQLRSSGQGMCVYWIRYALEDGTYGQWVKYTIHDYDVNAKENDEWEDKTTVSTQIVGVNKETGRVEHSNALSGTIDKDDNSLSYGNGYDVGEIDTSDAMNKFMDFLNAILSGLGQVPEFIARCFSFLPQWCTNLLGGMIVWCVIMRVLGR